MDVSIATRMAQLSPEQLRQLRKKVNASRNAGPPPLVPQARGTVLPLSFAQERLWFLEQLGAGSAYNTSTAVRIEGPLDLAALKRSFQEIVRRHEILRTRFDMRGEECAQIIEGAVDFDVALLDFSALPVEAAQSRAMQVVREDVRHRFDLRQGNLFRVTAIRLHPTEHLLAITMHHIVSDGWSMNVLLGELRPCYEAYLAGREPALPPLAVQYVDYAIWQRGWMQGELHERQMEYWQKQLADAPSGLSLPTDKPRPATPSFRGELVTFEFGGELSRQLVQFSRREGVTLYMLLLAGFQVLLSRWAGQKDVVVGSPIAARTHRETQELIGFFLNTLALRVELQDAPGFREVLRRVKQATLDGYAHQDMPFEKIVAQLQLGGDASRQALFQTMFTLESGLQGGIEFGGLKLRALPIEFGSAKFDLTLYMYDREGVLSGGFEYATDLFEAGSIERLAQYFQVLLGAAVSNPDCAISKLPLLSSQQRELMLVRWNSTYREWPQESVPELFERQAMRTPRTIALGCEDRQLNYEELNQRANRLAHSLRQQGVGPETLVALCMRRRVELVIAMLAVLKAGGAYTPVDPAYPLERLARMLKEANAKVLITEGTSGAWGTWLTEHRPVERIIDVDTAAFECPDSPTRNPEHAAAAAHLAYVIYTSGSTGQPKGAMVEHGSLANLLHWYMHALGLDQRDVCLVTTSCSFDLTQKNLLAPLLVGARVQLAPDGFDPASIVRTMSSVTVLNATPSMIHSLIDTGGESLPPLRWVVLGGEPVEPEKLLRWPQPRPQFMNSYGPTECSDVVVYHSLRDPTDYLDRSVPLGTPVANTKAYVLDENLQPVPIGAVGEVYIGGMAVGRGYLNRPDLTAQRFLSNPFAQGRMYKTGDLAKWTTDGMLEFLGRNDFQVKIRGFRIELSDIEVQLRAQPDVRDAIVLAREDDGAEKQLVAYVLAPSTLDTAELRRGVAKLLPDYMVPAAYLILDAWPLTPSGKIDRKALPKPERSAYGSNGYAAPEGTVEQALAELWQELLKVEAVGRHDNFFELGGHSLLVVRMLVRVREAFDVELPMRSVFEAPTVERLAAVIIEEILNGADSDALAEIDALTEA